MRKETKKARRKKREKALRKMKKYSENYFKHNEAKRMYESTFKPGHRHTKSNF